jgi:hypothetical protein
MALALLLCAGAQALVVEHVFTTSLADPYTTWTLDIPQFDSTLGPLTQVSVGITAYIRGTIGLENTTLNQSNQVTGTLASILTLTQGANTLIEQPVSASVTEVFPAYDGSPDYDGASGTMYVDWQGSSSGAYTTSAPADLVLYSDVDGPPLGTITFGLAAAAETFQVTSDAIGKTAIGMYADPRAWATVTVTYVYVPEPSALSLAGLAAVSVLSLRRRRRSA